MHHLCGSVCTLQQTTTGRPLLAQGAAALQQRLRRPAAERAAQPRHANRSATS